MNRKKYSTRDLILCGIFAALICIGAFIRIPIPVVPATLQVQFVILAGLLLGGPLGGASAFVYLALGLIGLPVFTQGGGLSYLLKPTFGYIIGFVGGAYVTGKIAGKSKAPSYKRLFAATGAGLAVIYITGIFYFYVCNNYVLNIPFGMGTTLLYCFVMVIPGDLIFCTLVTVLSKRLIPVLHRERIAAVSSERR